MTIKIGSYNVDITVRMDYEEKATKLSAMYLLNELSIFCRAGADSFESEGATALAKAARDTATEIYTALAAKGCYKGL